MWRVLLGLLVLGVVLLLALPSGRAEAAITLTVNFTGDEGEPSAMQGDGRCDWDASTAGRQCTLRAAIEEANANSGGPDEIIFAIGGTTTVKTISPNSALPTVTNPVIIDGYTQSGASPNTLDEGNNAVLNVVLDGLNAGAAVIGLTIEASDSTIKGFVIRRFDDYGIQILSAVATGNTVEGNFIGVNRDGITDRGNTSGVYIESDSNTVGGTTSKAGNRIAHNGGNGVLIVGTDSVGNHILSNSIYNNAELGIDLGGINLADGVTANDTGDPDAGPNNLPNFPVIRSASRNSTTGDTVISGSLNSDPSQDFVVQCFLTNGAPTSAHGEGYRLLDTALVSTNASGNSRFSCVSSKPLVGQVPRQTVSATATNIVTGDTSEFSKNKAITTSPR